MATVTGQGEAERNLIEALRAVVGPSRVLTSFPDRLAYSRDCWPEGIILARGGQVMLHRPAAIALPGTEEEVAGVIRATQRLGVPLVPYGAGSGVCGGTLPDHGGVILDLKRLSSIERLDAQGLLLRVGAGAIGMVLQTELERQGLTLGHFPSSLSCSSVGGYLAARSAGQCSSRFGKIEDMVQSLRQATRGGVLVDSAPGPGAERWGGGLDPTQLWVGAEGTLGVITSGVLRLSPAPQVREYRGFRCESVEAGLGAIREVMQAGLRPTVMRLYDEFDSLVAGSLSPQAMRRTLAEPSEESLPEKLLGALREAAGKALPERLRRRGGFLPDIGERVKRATRGLLGRAVGQPLLLNQLADALPGGCLLIVGFEGDAASREAEAGLGMFRRRCVDLGPEPGEHWLRNRFNVSYKQSPMFEAGLFVDTMEVATTWSNLVPLYRAVKRAVGPHAFIMAHFSHAYAEGASIYFTFAGFGADTADTLEVYRRIWRVAQEAVIQSGASVAHHHGVGVSKARNVPWDHVGGRPLFEAVLAGWNPTGGFNPGKVWTSQPSPTEPKVELAGPSSARPAARAAYRPGAGASEFARRHLDARPAARPEGLSELAQLLGSSAQPLRPVGSGRHGGAEGVGEALLLDLRGMDRVLGWDERSRVVQVEPGVTLGRLAQELQGRGASLCGWRREHPESTIGGLLSAWSPVQPALWNGSLREACIALTAISGQGRGYKSLEAPRKAAGPDLRHLFLGAQGRFGVIAAATLGVGGPAKARAAFEVEVGAAAQGPRLVAELFGRGFRAPTVAFSAGARKLWALLEGEPEYIEVMSNLLRDQAKRGGLEARACDPDGGYDPRAGDLRLGADPWVGRAEDALGGWSAWGHPRDLALLPEGLLGRGVLYDCSAHQASLWVPASSSEARALRAELGRSWGWWDGAGWSKPDPAAAQAQREAWAEVKAALDPRGVLPGVAGSAGEEVP